MKYWKIVEAGNYKIYTAKLVELFNNRHDEYFNFVNTFWHPLNDDKVNSITDVIPEFNELINMFGPIKHMALLILRFDESTLHIDHTMGPNNGVQARLNIPIINCKGSITAFFELDDEIFNNHTVDQYGTKSWPADIRNSQIPTTEIELIQPTILKVSAPHTVFCKDCLFPRVALTIAFEKDLVEYLVD